MSFQEVFGDIWALPPADAMCITTNGFVTQGRDGARCVMGRGVAKQACQRHARLEFFVGSKIMEAARINSCLPLAHPAIPLDYERRHAFLAGNLVHDLGPWTPSGNYKPVERRLVTFPVKRHWRERAIRELITYSAEQLRDLIKAKGWRKVYLPRPGCGNGGLDWAMVRPALEGVLPPEVVVVAYKWENEQ